MQNVSIAGVFKNLGFKALLTIILSIILTCAAIGYMGSRLYKSVNDELQLRGEMDVIQSSDRFSQYLMFDKNELTVAGYAVNNMLIKDASNEKILKYMKEQSERMKNALDKSFTGLYGYIKEEYLDGAGWVPDDGFIPTERPWYKAAIAHPNETVFVDPYVDKQTGKVMITIAELLDDKKSVIALDIGLNGVQKITDDIAKDTPGAMVMVLDSSNVAVAHSKNSEVGKDYSKGNKTLGSTIVSKMGKKEENSFRINHKGESYMVFYKQIESGWHCISVINTNVFYKPLKKVLLITICIGLISIILLLIFFYRLSLRELSNKNLHIQIQAAADIYGYFLDIVLAEDAYYNINDRINQGKRDLRYKKNAQAVLLEHIEVSVDESSKSYLREFVDFSTLNDRLKDKDTITAEWLDIKGEWYRARFICADRFPDGTVTRVLLGTEKIDIEKKERESLRNLAERDLMTRIYNRVTGESKVNDMLESGRGGMFALFDIDKFKRFNDTYGHNVGDQVIISVANCLKHSFRSDDIVMRLGGDEFAAFAAGVDSRKSGEIILERFYDNLSNIVVSKAEAEKISVSIGAVFCEDSGWDDTIDDRMNQAADHNAETLKFKHLYEAADHCMYESKKISGRHVSYRDITSSLTEDLS